MDNGTNREKKSALAIVQTILLAAILALMIIIGVVALRGFTSIQRNMALIEQDLQEIDMDEINTTIVSLKGAANSLGELDMDALNELLKSLDDTAKNLETVTGVFGNLFGR